MNWWIQRGDNDVLERLLLLNSWGSFKLLVFKILQAENRVNFLLHKQEEKQSLLCHCLWFGKPWITREGSWRAAIQENGCKTSFMSISIGLIGIPSASPAGVLVARALTEDVRGVGWTRSGPVKLQPIFPAPNISFPLQLIAWVPVPPYCQ